MNTLKSIYMPIRRYFFLDEDGAFHSSDTPWLICMPVLTVIGLMICITTIY